MTGWWVALRRGVAAQDADSMGVLCWPTRAEAQAWCEGRPKGDWYPEKLVRMSGTEETK